MLENEMVMMKQGVSTERESGKVASVGAYTDYFRTYADSEEGDSGGPYYERFGDSIYISGVHRGSASSVVQGDSEATYIGAIEDKLDVEVEGTVRDAP